MSTRLLGSAVLTIRREELLASLTKEQDSIIKTKKEIKQRFDAVDTYLNDYSKVSYMSLNVTGADLKDHKCSLEKSQGCWRDHIIEDKKAAYNIPVQQSKSQHQACMYVYVYLHLVKFLAFARCPKSTASIAFWYIKR